MEIIKNEKHKNNKMSDKKPKHDYRKQGKANRAAGKRFELKVRQDLEEKGWIVFRNSNDVEINKDVVLDATQNTSQDAFNRRRFQQAKSKWNPAFNRPMMTQSGFPDFVCIRKTTCGSCVAHGFGPCSWGVSFVECKCNGTLSKEEKEKAKWIKDNLHIDVYVASKGVKRGVVEYELVG